MRFRSIALLLLYATTANAADWRYNEPQPPRRVVFDEFVPDRHGGLWAFGEGTVQYLDGAGVLSGAHRISQGTGRFSDPFKDGFALADGGAIVVSGVEGACRAGRVDRHLQLTWTRGITSWYCDQIAVNADGAIWSPAIDGIERIGSDGSIKARVDLSAFGPGTVTALAVDADAGVIVAIRDSQPNPYTAVASYAADGRQRWAFTPDTPYITDIAVLANGDIITAGIASGPLQVTLIAPGGTRRWTRDVTGTQREGRAELLVDAAGITLVGSHSWAENSTTVARLTYDGAVRWQSSPCGAFFNAAGSPNGDVAVACFDPVPGFHRWNDSGVKSAYTPLPWSHVTDLDYGPGGMLFVAGRTYPARDGEINALAFDAAGNAVASPLTAAQPDIGVALAQHTAPDGTTYMASRTGGPLAVRGERLSKFSADSTLLWSRDIGTRLRATHDIIAGSDRVCAVGEFVPAPGSLNDSEHWKIVCFDATRGDVLWEEGTSSWRAAFTTMLDDGRVLVVFASRSGSGFQVMRIDRDGHSQLSEVTEGIPVLANIEASGRLTVVTANAPIPTALAVQRFDANGNTVFSTGETASRTQVAALALAVAPDGTAYLLASKNGRVGLRSIDAGGVLKWRKDVLFQAGDSPPFGNLFATNDAIWLYQNSSTLDAAAIQDTSWLLRIEPADGGIVWQQVSHHPAALGRTAGVATMTPDAQTLVVVDAYRNRMRLQAVSAATGRSTHDRSIRCADECLLPLGVGVGIGRDDVVRLAATTVSARSGQTATLIGIDMTVHAPIRLDQPGIAGAWWSPYANGEGFVLDYLPDSHVLFMPWFTFSREGGNDPAGQRWYVVQGSVDANATSIELPITESIGGAFDAGPPVTPTIVGTATLSFTDCDNGTLSYRFNQDRNGGAAGTITLSRLSPATQNCVLADGSVQTRTSTPANGFDARMSGSWFEPATSGQGLQFTVQPGGIFFAPWFAYDPADAADDPGKQRWYTIQGSLGDARNGVVELPIVQTIGGTFDSVPTNNMYPVGKATLTMLACDRAKLDYRFDDNELAAPMRARTGSIDLVKAGGCTGQ